MTTWVRRNGAGKVVETTNVDPAGRYHPSIIWENQGSDEAATLIYASSPSSLEPGGYVTRYADENNDEDIIPIDAEEPVEETANTESTDTANTDTANTA